MIHWTLCINLSIRPVQHTSYTHRRWLSKPWTRTMLSWAIKPKTLLLNPIPENSTMTTASSALSRKANVQSIWGNHVVNATQRPRVYSNTGGWIQRVLQSWNAKLLHGSCADKYAALQNMVRDIQGHGPYETTRNHVNQDPRNWDHSKPSCTCPVEMIRIDPTSVPCYIFGQNMQHQHPFINFQRQGVSKQSGTLQHYIQYHYTTPSPSSIRKWCRQKGTCLVWREGFISAEGWVHFSFGLNLLCHLGGYPRNVINCY